MSKDNHFFMREPWTYDPEARPKKRDDGEQGFNTRALHAGFHPLGDLEPYRSFVPPITQSAWTVPSGRPRRMS